MTTVVITKELIRRLVKDIRDIQNHPLHSNGIYYHHDDDDMMIGYALIIGPSNTPYFGGYYFFKINFTDRYPFEPPKVTYYTNGNDIRFNPNLYKNGKVCISLLNTWQGDQWTSCQTITSILLTLCTLFNDVPLLNEPHVTLQHHDVYNYNSVIEFYNISIAICDVVNKHSHFYENDSNSFFLLFEEIVIKTFLENMNHYVDFIQSKIENGYKSVFVIRLYGIHTMIDYSLLLEKLMETQTNLIVKK